MRLTQPRAFGAFTGQPYGAFDGRGGRPVGRLTQLRSFGAFTGGRYGSFEGRVSITPPVIHPDRGGGVVMFARPVRKQEQDDLLLLIAAQIAIGMFNE